MLIRWTVAASLVVLLAAAHGQIPQDVTDATPYVVVLHIEGMIDEGINVVVERAIREAAGAEALIFVIDTPGGRVDSAIDITSAILEAPAPTIAYPVGMGAISAGALIAFACDHIAMAPGANIGAATPVVAAPEGMQPTGEKEVSFVRARFRSLAETKGHSVALAEAMVDKDIELRGYVDEDGAYVVYRSDQAADQDEPRGEVILASDKLLTLTAQEALRYGLIGTVAASQSEVLGFYGYEDAALRTIEWTWAESVFRFLTSPTVVALLLLGGIGGLYLEMQTPGFGVGGTIGLICLALFFGSHLVLGIAGWVDVALVLIGVTLIAVEIFVLPGFGIAGITGIGVFFVGLYLSLTRVPIPQYSWDYERLGDVAYSFLLAAVGLIALIALTWKLLPRTPLYGRLVLTTAQAMDAGYVVQTEADESAVGLEGVALTMLRPAGRGRFGGKTYDIVSRSEFIEKGSPIVIVQVDGNRYVVDKLEEQR